MDQALLDRIVEEFTANKKRSVRLEKTKFGWITPRISARLERKEREDHDKEDGKGVRSEERIGQEDEQDESDKD